MKNKKGTGSIQELQSTIFLYFPINVIDSFFFSGEQNALIFVQSFHRLKTMNLPLRKQNKDA